MSRVKKRIEKNYIRYAAQTPFPKMGTVIVFPELGKVRRGHGEFICSI